MEQLGFDAARRMLLAAVDQIKANHEKLSQLDSFGGDGDHGTTMVRAMECLARGVEQVPGGTLKDLFNSVGWAIMGVDGGATGPLFGSFFMGMAAAPESDGHSTDGAGLAAMFEAGMASVRTVSKAQVGDKTMIDALAPAVEAAHQAAAKGGGVDAVLEQAAEAARTGAESTKDLQARFGRAKNIGEKSKGHPDAGATSVSLVFRGFVEGVQG